MKLSQEVMDGLKNNCVRKQMDKWMDGESVRVVEYNDVDKALRLCLRVLKKSVNYRLQGTYTQWRITLTLFHRFSLSECSQLLAEKGMHGLFF